MTVALPFEDALRALDDGRRRLLLVGSGVSIPAPCNAPGASKVLEASLDALLDAALDPVSEGVLRNVIHERCFPQSDAPGGLLPEVLYGAIADVYETIDHLRLWSALLARSSDAACGRPNAGHHLLVALAARDGSAILTTNFDCFLEDAAANFGLDPEVLYPTPAGALHRQRRAGSDLTIWKIHGTACDWKSVRSRASDLSQASRIVQAAELGFVEGLIIAGYSGRDFDVFPWVAERFANIASQTIWIARNQGNTRVDVLDGAMFCQGNFEALARETLKRSSLSDRFPYLRQLLADLPSVDAKATFLQEHVAREARNEVERVLNTDTRRARAAVAEILSALGAHALVLEVTASLGSEWLLPPEIEADVHLMRAHSLSSRDRFGEARLESDAARRLAAACGDPSRSARACIAQVYARFSSAFLRLPGRPSLPRLLLSPGAWRLIVEQLRLVLAFTITTIRLANPGRRAVARVASDDTRTSGPEYRFACDYIEQLIRYAAFVQSSIGRLLPRRARGIAWARLDRMSRTAGYTWGVVNVAKYRSRSPGLPAFSSARIATEVYPDDIPKAIAHLDAGRQLWRVARREEAEIEFAAAEDAARRAGCPSLLWKIAFARCGDEGSDLDRQCVDELMEMMDAHAVRVMEPWLRASATRRVATSKGSAARSGDI